MSVLSHHRHTPPPPPDRCCGHSGNSTFVPQKIMSKNLGVGEPPPLATLYSDDWLELVVSEFKYDLALITANILDPKSVGDRVIMITDGSHGILKDIALKLCATRAKF